MLALSLLNVCFSLSQPQGGAEGREAYRLGRLQWEVCVLSDVLSGRYQQLLPLLCSSVTSGPGPLSLRGWSLLQPLPPQPCWTSEGKRGQARTRVDSRWGPGVVSYGVPAIIRGLGCFWRAAGEESTTAAITPPRLCPGIKLPLRSTAELSFQSTCHAVPALVENGNSMGLQEPSLLLFVWQKP